MVLECQCRACVERVSIPTPDGRGPSSGRIVIDIGRGFLMPPPEGVERLSPHSRAMCMFWFSSLERPFTWCFYVYKPVYVRATAADFCGDSLSFFVHLQGESVAISSCTHDTNGTLRTHWRNTWWGVTSCSFHWTPDWPFRVVMLMFSNYRAGTCQFTRCGAFSFIRERITPTDGLNPIVRIQP